MKLFDKMQIFNPENARKWPDMTMRFFKPTGRPRHKFGAIRCERDGKSFPSKLEARYLECAKPFCLHISAAFNPQDFIEIDHFEIWPISM